MIKFLIPLTIIIATPAIAGERLTLGACMAASAVAGAHHYKWQEKKFTREDCEAISSEQAPKEAITEQAPKAAEPAPIIETQQKPDPFEIHIHNPEPPAPIIIQKPAPTINIHIHNERSHPAPSSNAPVYHWEEIDRSQAAPGYWSHYSNGQHFFHQFHDGGSGGGGRHDY
jgi:hypothetical protein